MHSWLVSVAGLQHLATACIARRLDSLTLFGPGIFEATPASSARCQPEVERGSRRRPRFHHQLDFSIIDVLSNGTTAMWIE